MIKISHAVETIVRSSETAFESLRTGTLSLSAYALRIKPDVERLCVKPVQTGSIVVALSRLAPTLAQEAPIRPLVRIDDLSVTSPLCDLSYEKTSATLHAIKELEQQRIGSVHDFFTVTQGIHEVTIVCSQKHKDHVLSIVGQPKALFENVTGISVRFDQKYLDEPNAMYTLMGTLSPLRINVLEIISTYTELTFIIHQQDTQRSVEALTQLMHAVKSR